jgi:hypothetical protein
VKTFVAILVLFFCTTQSYAFQETDVPVAVDAVAGNPVESNGAAQLANPGGDEEASSSKGTSINIPGIGNIGTLPKLDFGLELLYKDDEPKTVDELNNEDGLAIKGRLKHKF